MESNETPAAEHDLVEDLMRCCDGVLLCSPRMDRAELVELAGRNHPMVLFNRVVPGLSVPSISVDVHGGMTQVLGTGVTAVLGYNDLVAFGALSRLQELKVVVPSDLTVVGFDDISLDHVAHTSLTTVAVSRDDLGRRPAKSSNNFSPPATTPYPCTSR